MHTPTFSAILSVLFLCIAPMSLHAQSWNESMYNSYSYRTYTQYAPLNEVINPSLFDARLLNAAVFYETNRQRVLNNRTPFRYDYALEVCAHNHTYDMVTQDFFSHTSTVPGKKTMSDRMRQVGYTNVACAEKYPLQNYWWYRDLYRLRTQNSRPMDAFRRTPQKHPQSYLHSSRHRHSDISQGRIYLCKINAKLLTEINRIQIKHKFTIHVPTLFVEHTNQKTNLI